MNRALPYKTKQFFFVLIKLSIVIGAFYFIYNKVTSNPDLRFSDFVSILSKNRLFSLKNVSFLIVLSIFNWFFEIIKWQYLVDSVKKITFFEALKQSLGSLTASLLTPNRIGEYGAKALYYSSNYRKRILLLNFIGNVLQMSITVLFGVIAIYYFVTDYNIEFSPQKVVRFFLIIVIIFAFSVFGAKQKRFRIKGFSIKKIIEFIKNLPSKTKLLGFVFSLLRYLIFSFQFYFLLHIFNVDIFYMDAMVLISSLYLLASIIPSVFIFDVLIKGSVAVYIFSAYGVHEFTILSIVLLMWILNFVLPSLIGSFYVLTFKLPKNNAI
ncbi:lysylphosphatidylglycerol synthase domain-containing protein [Lacinutrix iliipiscaria]